MLAVEEEQFGRRYEDKAARKGAAIDHHVIGLNPRRKAFPGMTQRS
jgi:hypothetical protein